MIVLRRILFCGSLPPLIALPRGFFAGACLRLACDGRRRGSAGWAPWRLREASTSESTTDLRKIVELSAFWRIGSRQGLCLRVVFSRTCSLTSDPWGGSASRPPSALWRPARESLCSDLGDHWNAPRTHATQASLRTAVYQKFKISRISADERDERESLALSIRSLQHLLSREATHMILWYQVPGTYLHTATAVPGTVASRSDAAVAADHQQSKRGLEREKWSIIYNLKIRADGNVRPVWYSY